MESRDGVPINLDDEEHDRLPVGTLALASTHAQERSILDRGLTHVVRKHFFFEIQESLAELLCPD